MDAARAWASDSMLRYNWRGFTVETSNCIAQWVSAAPARSNYPCKLFIQKRCLYENRIGGFPFPSACAGERAGLGGVRRLRYLGYRKAARACALVASSMRFFSGAFGSSELSSLLETAPISSTALRNAAS